jgi:hypothetical protein
MKTLDEVEPRIPISSLPFAISESGSYYLTGNLRTRGNGITVTANDVTIDLMGYAITGGNGNGIDIFGCINVEIRNGTIRKFALQGIHENYVSGRGHRIIGIRVIENGGRGVELNGRGHLLKECTAVGNGKEGFYVSTGSVVCNNTATDNGDNGITCYQGNTVVNNAAYYNGDWGILLHTGFLDGNSAENNNTNDSGSNEIHCSTSCTYGTNHTYTP